MRVRRGFTLIELLVVIAIIAILAAILFPVFATAREKARQSQCISNAKQIGTAVFMYNQDYDEIMPLFFRNYGAAGRDSWASLVQPYVKNWALFRCPNMADATSGGTSIWTSANKNNLCIWPGYGYNVYGMNFDNSTTCATFDTNNRSGPPTALALIARPAGIVLAAGASLEPGSGSFAGANSLYPTHGGYMAVEAPAGETDPTGCTWSNGAWGQGSYMGPYGGFDQPRHQNQGGTLVFCDGHTKFTTAGQAAAGTSWNVNATNTDIVITDRTKYMWNPTY